MIICNELLNISVWEEWYGEKIELMVVPIFFKSIFTLKISFTIKLDI